MIGTLASLNVLRISTSDLNWSVIINSLKLFTYGNLPASAVVVVVDVVVIKVDVVVVDVAVQV